MAVDESIREQQNERNRWKQLELRDVPRSLRAKSSRLMLSVNSRVGRKRSVRSYLGGYLVASFKLVDST